MKPTTAKKITLPHNGKPSFHLYEPGSTVPLCGDNFLLGYMGWGEGADTCKQCKEKAAVKK